MFIGVEKLFSLARLKLGTTGRSKKNYHFTFCLIFQEPKIRITNRFCLLKIEINAQILNTEPLRFKGTDIATQNKIFE